MGFISVSDSKLPNNLSLIEDETIFHIFPAHTREQGKVIGFGVDICVLNNL